MPGQHTERAFKEAIEQHLPVPRGYAKDGGDSFDYVDLTELRAVRKGITA